MRQRRTFLKQVSLGVAAGGASLSLPGIRTARAADAPPVKWTLASTFDEGKTALYGAAKRFAEIVSDATGGRFEIALSSGVAAASLLDAVAKADKVQAGHALSTAWLDKTPAYAFAAAVPFGLNARAMNAWMFNGDGLKRTRDLFRSAGVVNFPLGNTGASMGGWHRQEIKSVEGIKGLKVQADGLAALVFERMGAVPSKPEDAAQALGNGGLDVLAASNPLDDAKRGVPKGAAFYYAPGWQAVSAQASLIVNAKAWDDLPKSYKSVVETASRAAHLEISAQYDSGNAAALKTLSAGGAQLRNYPRSVLDAAWGATVSLYAELAEKDQQFKGLHDSLAAVRAGLTPWFQRTEDAYDEYLGTTLIFRQ